MDTLLIRGNPNLPSEAIVKRKYKEKKKQLQQRNATKQ
jgi:hypothetical protein